MATDEHVAVAIVGFRNPDDVATCLTALSRSTYPDFSVFVCENGGDAAFATLVEILPKRLAGGQDVVVLNAGGNLGYAGGVNRCIEAAGNLVRAVWVLNPDTAPMPEAMAALLTRLDRGDVAAVGGVVLWPNGIVQSYGGRWLPRSGRGLSIGMFTRADAPIDVATVEAQMNYLSGASMMVSRRFLDVVGPMREDYFLYCEEVDWFLRARQNDLKLGFAPDARVQHFQGTTTGWAGSDFRAWPRQAIYLDARNRVKMTGHLMRRFLPWAVAGILLHSLWRYARRGAWRQVGYVLEGVLAGLRGESGRPSWVG
jgi:N-acetylglucosaminyl-diphospho-decaprenol L-rhamnosyltransferase